MFKIEFYYHIVPGAANGGSEMVRWNRAAIQGGGTFALALYFQHLIFYVVALLIRPVAPFCFCAVPFAFNLS